MSNCINQAERDRTTELIRPILRGRDIKRYSYDWAELYLISTFPARHYDIELYPSLKNYLLSLGIERLEQTGKTYNIDGNVIKARKKTNNQWFETQDSISYWDDFNKPKIVYAELARTGNAFTIDNDQLLISNTSYMITFNKNIVCGELYNLLGFLNSKIALFYLDFSCSKFDDNGWRWLRQFVEKIPIPTIKSTELQTEVNNSLKCPTIENIRKINFLVYEIIGLNAKEVDYLEKKYSNY